LLTGVLRGELGYDGVIITDALDMGAISDGVGEPAGAVAALKAGADALCLGAVGGEGLYRRVREAVVAAVAAGELPLARLEQAADRVEALLDWIRAASPHSEPPSAADPGLTAARRAVQGRVPALSGPPVVVELRGATNLAVGEAFWGLAEPLRDAGRPPLSVWRLTDADTSTLDAVLTAAAGHPLVVVGRDVPRQAWQRQAWTSFQRHRPDAVLVEIGLPRPGELPGEQILVGGAGRPNLRAAAELLAAGPQR
jgi:beta-N-acetylhexosaminidase